MAIQDKKEKGAATLTVKGNWDEQSKMLQKKYNNLTDADVKFETGKEEELLKRMETRLGKNRDEVIGIINEGQTQKK